MNLFFCLIVVSTVTIENSEADIEVDETILQRIVTDILNILYRAPIFERITCDSVNNSLVNFDLYTSQNKDEPVILRAGEVNNLTLFNPSLETKLLIHGWIGNVTDWMRLAKNEYLRTGDYNIILLDWSAYALNMYSQSVCFLKEIAEKAAHLLIQIRDEANLDFNKTHVIGHSLGGQMAGLIGQNIDKLTGGEKVYRITGLDAAGPLFCYPVLEDNDKRITSDDAYFVDGIHTSEEDYGCDDPYGHVNFYPNCGRTQAGCESTNFTFSNITGSLQNIFDRVSCSHQRAPIYWIESINSDGFVSVFCSTCAEYILETCERDENITTDICIMGEHLSLSTPKGKYYLSTRSTWPYVMNDDE
ncbi:pancreatic lipase-related protein 2-like [Agrilus planipennis]|uniref:Pancreatic lipase-related protein 2-like n=1 Tax=Agrilus planipennis TaxID=224129 RepID=A0A1W4XS53_AGRPL|nr:pancreatic lipase-related protein 2-like [Agrilus planipennis]